MNINPMRKALEAPRCTAKSKRTGQRCRAPAVKGWKVCRMHGARTKEMIALRKLLKSLR